VLVSVPVARSGVYVTDPYVCVDIIPSGFCEHDIKIVRNIRYVVLNGLGNSSVCKYSYSSSFFIVLGVSI
jgi:hypothetical protein